MPEPLTDDDEPAAPPPPEGEPIRLRGRVERGPGAASDEPVVLRATLAIEGAPSRRAARGEGFRLRCDDGRVVDIDVARGRNATRCVPWEKTRARWSRVESDPRAEPFRANAPGPDVTVGLHGFALREGDTAEVFGYVTARAFAEHADGPRDAPESHVARVRARIVAAGSNPARAMREAYAELFPPAQRAATRRAPRVTLAGVARVAIALVVALAAAGFLAYCIQSDKPAVRLEGIAGALTALALIVMGLLAPRYPAFAQGSSDKPIEEDQSLARQILAGTLLLSLGMLLPMAVSTDLHRNETSARAMYWMLAGFTLVGAVIRALLGRKAVATAALLLRARRFDASLAPDTWGSALGTVRDPTPVTVQGEVAALGRTRDVTVTPGSDPNIVKTSVANQGTFFVDGEHAVFEIAPDEALWATTAVTVEPTKEGRVEREVVPVGGRVLVAGRLRRGRDGAAPQLKSTGPRSLVFFATGADGDPAAALRRVWWLHWLAVALMVALAGTTVAVGLAMGPELPPEAAPSD